MLRMLKILFLVMLVIAGLIAAAVLAINLIPGERFKPLISYAVHSATGRDLAIEGDLSVDLTSTLAFSASDVRFANSGWGSRPEMFRSRRIQGQLALAPLLQGVLDIRLVLQAPDLLLETNPEGLGNWQLGDADEPAHGLALHPFIRELRLEQVRVAYLNGSTLDKNSATFNTILFQSLGDQVVIRIDGQVNSIPVQIAGGVEHALDTKPGESARLNLSGNAGGVKLAGRGILSELSTTADVDLQVTLAAPTLTAFTPFVGQELPDYGPLQAEISILGSGGDYTVSKLQADLDSKALTLAVKASIADLAALAGIDAELSAETPNLPDIIKQLKIDLPAELPSAIKAQATFSGSLEQLSVGRFQVDAKDKGVRAGISGSVDNLITLAGIKAKASLNSDSLASLSRFAGAELPALGAVKASAKLISQGNRVGLRNIDAALNGKQIQAKLAGSIGDILTIKAIDVSARVDLDSLVSLNALTGQQLADAGPIVIDARLLSKGGLDKGSDIFGSIAGDGVKATIDGRVADLLTMQGIETTIDIRADSLRQLGRQAGVALEIDDPLALKGTIRSAPGSYRIEALQASLGESKGTGEAIFKLPGKPQERSRATGRLHLDKVDLNRLGLIGDAGTGTPVDPAAESPAKADSLESASKDGMVSQKPSINTDDKVFSSDPLPLDLLTSVDLDLDLSVDEILTRRILMRDVSAELKLENGLLTIKPIQAAVGEGTVRGGIELDAQRSPPALIVKLALAKGTFRNFGGRYDLKIDLNGSGDSIAALLAGLDGQVILDARDVELQRSLMTDFGRGLFDSLNPFDKEEKTSRLICAIARFDISDGVANADDRLVAQMTKVTWFGGGEIDLKNETLSLGAQSKPRSGLGLKLFSGVASLVHLGGTLAHPSIQLDPKGVAKKYGEAYLTVATGGLYALAKGLWDKNEANSDVCAEILAMKKGESKRRLPPASSTPLSPRQDALPEQPVKP